MYRVLVPACLSLLLAGCGMSNSSLMSGFADSGQPTNAISPSRSQRSGATAMATDPSPAARSPAKSTDQAKASDRIPKGTFEKAPAGARGGAW